MTLQYVFRSTSASGSRMGNCQVYATLNPSDDQQYPSVWPGLSIIVRCLVARSITLSRIRYSWSSGTRGLTLQRIRRLSGESLAP